MRAAALAGVAALAFVAASSAPADTRPLTIEFQGSYVLAAHASQAPYRPATAACVPGVVQAERETITWTVRFRPVRLGRTGTVTVAAQRTNVKGVHVWDEASAECRAYPAGHLVCRTHFAPEPVRLVVVAVRGVLSFHPSLRPVAISDGCRGEVYNEHPDCGARDASAITDFGFTSSLRPRAPRIVPPAARASFDISRSKGCIARGKRNLNEIHQDATSRYRGVFTIR